MKHLFIINPAAGKYDQTGEFTQKIRTACENAGVSYEILVSRAQGDCTKIARDAAQIGEELRIYACGGDGTLYEVVNGVYGYPNVAITHYPGGSGNDFIKVFSNPSAFRDLERLIDGDEAVFDLIQCCDNHYSLNICSMGLDARIASDMSKYKHLPLVNGNGAYILSAGVNLVKGIAEHMAVEIDGKRFDARFTLVCIANGRHYGGSFNPVPDAELDDGYLDVLLIKGLSRLTVASIIGKYQKGLYRQYPDLIKHFRCKNVVVHCDKARSINLDGESLIEKDAAFTILPQAIRFFYPKGLTYHTT